MIIPWSTVGAGLLLGAKVSARASPSSGNDAPIVNLGYARHKAAYDNAEDLYTFKNIRFADPPLGQLRFKPPRPVSTVNHTVNDGSVGFKCPQAYPEWDLQAQAEAAGVTTEQLRDQLLQDPTMDEDCLFLDVVVPPSIYSRTSDAAQDKSHHQNRKAPVMVWIYGGGYVFGQKDPEGSTSAGLIDRSMSHGGEGVIYVALNYRLGLFGWLNALGDERIFPNVALQDQHLALKWVKKYIHLFGGDPDQVTVFGESAGGGSIMHQITGNGGKTKVPFERAIVQSPGWLTALPVAQLWNQTLTAASERAGRPVRNGADLASLDYKSLLQTNSDVVFESIYGDFGYGPTVDGGFVPDYPGVSLLKGHFDKSPEVMAGHNSHEADVFTSTDIDSQEKIMDRLRSQIYGIKDSTIDYILNELYPPPSETDLYTTEYARATLLFSEYIFVCNTRYLATAYNDDTWNYRFQVPPGYHAQDVPYTYYGPNSTDVNADLAVQMQLFFTQFAAKGNPNSPAFPSTWLRYGRKANIATFGSDGVGKAIDDAANKRCAYWQKGTYTPRCRKRMA